VKSQEPPQAAVQEAHPYKAENTSSGLLELLQHLMALAHTGDSAQLSILIEEMEIPNHRAWLTDVYGPEKGAELADAYAKELRKSEREFRDSLIQLASQDGEVLTKGVSDPARFGFKTQVPLRDFYFANWKSSRADKARRDPIGYFVYLDGQFRWYCLVELSREIQQAKLIRKVSPAYPREAAAKDIHGTVELRVLIGKDGSVNVEKVLSGDPLLAPAAIDAVRQWRYKPLLLNGQPAAVQTTITVNFERKR
jgi:TonB family protein